MAYEDKNLTCNECNDTFVWTAGEQEFYAQRNLTNEPKRCPTCRQARRGSYGGRGGGGGAQREMHPAVCAQCGKDTMVPFKPRGDRPVYCSDCYSQQASSTQRY